MSGAARAFVFCALLPAALGVVVSAVSLMPAGRLPQVAKGGDVLSVAFADARETIGLAMLRKADSYFHGGVDVDCHEGHGCARCHGCRGHGAAHGCGFDPWRWVNSHVRAPERHMHLDDGRAVEMMPWFWAAVRADPHNADAWTTAAYAADRMMKDRPLARRIIREAREKNPESLEIAVAEARMAYDGGKGDVAEARRLFEAARALAMGKCGGRPSELSEADAEMYRQIDVYLTKMRGEAGSRP